MCVENVICAAMDARATRFTCFYPRMHWTLCRPARGSVQAVAGYRSNKLAGVYSQGGSVCGVRPRRRHGAADIFKSKCTELFAAGLRSRCRSIKVPEVFGWCRNRIPKNTGSRTFYLTPEGQLNHFLHRTPKLGILTRACWNGTTSFETFIETENCCCVPRFPLMPVALQNCWHPNLNHVKESEILERPESDILPPTPQPWFAVSLHNLVYLSSAYPNCFYVRTL